MDFSNLITREIDERFCHIKYDDFGIIMKDNGFINATKLCELREKEFKKWIRLDGSKELIKTLEDANNFWKVKSPESDLARVILEVDTERCKHQDYQDLVPSIASWISPSFAIKVSKIINCYISGNYEFKLKEREEEIRKRENKIDELMELLFNDKYDRGIAEDKELYREQCKQVKELKEHNKELYNSAKLMEEKYDRDTNELKSELREVKTELKKIEERLKDKVINPTSLDKLHHLMILQNEKDINSFKTLQIQTNGVDRELYEVKQDYKVFLNAYEPNVVSCFNRLKERLL
ncbi:KilA N domain protein [Finch poxvirus]|uniref:KilA N domain protein n=2 Tax=unclassified Avipoxvirus TaxID=336487 RepID=A0AAT9UQY2_9POXV|nr:KilA N domain protein [Finch poxvirus]UOX38981.1 KilA N domain protein [Finch poxvirus]